MCIPYSYHMVMGKKYNWIEAINSGWAKDYKYEAACILCQYYPCLQGCCPWMVHPYFWGNSPPLQCHFYNTEDTQVLLHINNLLNNKEYPCINQIIPHDEDNLVENCNGFWIRLCDLPWPITVNQNNNKVIWLIWVNETDQQEVVQSCTSLSPWMRS